MLDIITVVILIISLILGVTRGFVKELFGLICIILAIFITIHNYAFFIDLLDIQPTKLACIGSTLAVYILTSIVITLVNSWLMHVLKPIRLGRVDKFLGGISGAIKGGLICYLIFAVLQLFYYTFSSETKLTDKVLPTWITSAYSYPVFKLISNNLDNLVPNYIYEDIEKMSNNFNKTSKNQGGNTKITVKKQ